MNSSRRSDRVAIVTGGGGGIGAAVAAELGANGFHVATVDPLVEVDGTQGTSLQRTSTADDIRAKGGSAEQFEVSVTDAVAMRQVVSDLLAKHGRLDAVVNVAGISRPTSFAKGNEEDWRAVTDVHLHGYINLLNAALPHFLETGTGHVVGVTSGSGWRTADAGAYGCAKRAVAALTWRLGKLTPQGVHINAISPIALTRMVTAALARAGSQSKPAKNSTGGLALGALPPPEHIGPIGAALAGLVAAPRGRILFAGGSEVAVLDEPKLLETVRCPADHSADTLVKNFWSTLLTAEKSQATAGGANSRFANLFAQSPDSIRSRVASVLLVSDRGPLLHALRVRLEAAGAAVKVLDPSRVGSGFAGAQDALKQSGSIDAVIVAIGSSDSELAYLDEQDPLRVLASHNRIGDAIIDDARWSRACAEYSAARSTETRLVQIIDSRGAAGATRAQAVTQLTRASLGATGNLVSAFCIAYETDHNDDACAAIAEQCALGENAQEISGAELVVSDGWFGLRSHPKPTGSIVLGDCAIPDWFGQVLSEMCR